MSDGDSIELPTPDVNEERQKPEVPQQIQLPDGAGGAAALLEAFAEAQTRRKLRRWAKRVARAARAIDGLAAWVVATQARLEKEQKRRERKDEGTSARGRSPRT